MEKIEPVCLVDLDSTLADYNFSMFRDMEKILDPNEDFEDIKKILLAFCDEKIPPYLVNRIRLIRSQPGWWATLQKLQLGFNLLDMVKQLNFDITILTKAPSSCLAAYTEKAVWCHNNLEDFKYKIHIGQDKGLVYGKVLIDDYPPYLLRWLKWRPRGLAIVPAAEHNVKFKHPNAIRYTGENDDEVFAALKKARSR